MKTPSEERAPSSAAYILSELRQLSPLNGGKALIQSQYLGNLGGKESTGLIALTLTQRAREVVDA